MASSDQDKKKGEDKKGKCLLGFLGNIAALIGCVGGMLAFSVFPLTMVLKILGIVDYSWTLLLSAWGISWLACGIGVMVFMACAEKD